MRQRAAIVVFLAVLLAGCADRDQGAVDAVAPAPDGAPPDALQPDAPPPPPQVVLPRSSIAVDELAVIVNESDPQSVEVAGYYVAQRGIPSANVIKVQLPSTSPVMTVDAFNTVKAQVDAATPPAVQAYALTWMWPYGVGCMSITSAFALGYDAKYCNDPAVSGKACETTAPVDYYLQETTRPYTDFGLRPAMMLAAVSAQEGKALVDRGLAAEGTLPPGKGWMIRTTDVNRSNPRYLAFQDTVKHFNHPGGIELEYIDNSAGTAENDVIANVQDVLFYFTGLTHVDKIETNTYRPGAVADHLTSYGGQLKPANAGGQMSVLRWLEAGATGSYGTVVEPCAWSLKFPDTRILLPFYFRGNTLVEAYWKSVAWPGEGIFIGDPLARPWGTQVVHGADTLTIRTTILAPLESYQLLGVGSDGKKAVVVDKIEIDRHQLEEISVSPVLHRSYELVRVTP